MRAPLSALRPLALPLAATTAAALLSLAALPLGPRGPFALFIAAVLASAWWGGWRPALLTTALSAGLLGLFCWFRGPAGESLDDFFVRLGMFVLVGLLGGTLSQQCKRAIRAVDHVHDVLAGSGLALLTVDPQGQVTSLTPLARTLTGWGDADAVGVPLDKVFRLLDGQTRQPLVLPLADALAGTGPSALPEGAILSSAAGTETAVEGAALPARGDDGTVNGVVLTFRAAAGRKDQVRDLQQMAERFRALAGYAPTPLLVLDADGQCIFTNPAGQAACDCSAEECLGQGWSRHVVAADRDRVLSRWLAAMGTRQPFADELRLQPPSGAMRWFRLRAAPMFAESGELLGQVATLEDVTDRREAENGLRDEQRLTLALLEAGPNPIVIKDAHGRLLHQNATATRWLDAGTWPTEPVLAEAEEAAWDTGRPQQCEVRTESAALDVSLIPSCDEAGEVVALVVHVHDRTELLRQDAARRQAEQEAEAVRQRVAALESERNEAHKEAERLLDTLIACEERVEAALHESERLREELRTTEPRTAAAQREAERLRDEFAAVREQLAQQERASEEASEQAEEWRARVEALSAARQALEESLASARQENARLTEEQARAELEAEEAIRLARAEQETQLQEARQAQQHLEEELRCLREQESPLARELEQARRLCAEAEERAAAHEETLRQLREERQRQQAEQEAVLGELRRSLAEWQQQVDEREHALTEARATADELRLALEDAQGRTADRDEGLRAAHEEALQQLLTRETEVARLHSEVEALRRSLDEAQAQATEREERWRVAQEEAERQRQQREAEATQVRSEVEALRRTLEAAREQTAERESELRRAEEEARRQEQVAEERARQLAEARAEAEARRRAEEELRRAEEAARRHQQAAEERSRELADARAEAEVRRRAEEELRREKEFLEGVIDGSPDGIFAHDRDGRCRIWNAALERLLNRPRAEALHRTAFEIFPTAKSDNLPSGWRADAPHPFLNGQHTPVRSASGEVVGGMAIVRAGEPEATEAMSARPATRPAAGGPDTNADWLAFN